MGADTHVRLELRDYQAEALDRVAKAEADGVRRQLGVAATGLGKTVMFATLAERRGGRTLILAHRDELVVQAAAKVLECWPGLGATRQVLDALGAVGGHDGLLAHVQHDPHGVGIVKAGADDVHARVVVASVQTLSRPTRLARLVAAYTDAGLLAEAGTAPFDLVVVDEAHHATATTYRAVLDGLRAGDPGCTCGEDVHERPATPAEVDAGCELGVAYDPCPGPEPGPLLLGVTATPDRGDGKGLREVFDQVVFSFDILWGIGAGFLSDLRGLRVQLDQLDLSDVKVERGDYAQGQAGDLMMKAGAPELLLKAWAEHAPDRKTLVFTPTVAMADAIAAEFVLAGYRAASLSGETPTDHRRKLLADFATGQVQVLANCAVLTEGFDEPTVDCVVVARPTKSRALYTQMVGRGTRRHPDKTDCLVLDVVGATDEHSLVTIPSLFGIAKGRQFEGLGDGSLGVYGAVSDHLADEVAAGRLLAREVELFAQVRAEGIAWVQVHQPGERRRYERHLGRRLPVVVMKETGDGDRWMAGLRYPPAGDQPARYQRLIEDVPLSMAQGVAEDVVRKLAPGGLVAAEAAWRARPPTAKQRAAAAKWKLPVQAGWTAGQLSDALDAHISRITYDRDLREYRRRAT